MKTQQLFLLLAVAPLVAFGNSHFRPGQSGKVTSSVTSDQRAVIADNGPGGPGRFGGGRGPRPDNLTETQKAAFEACLAQNNIAKPQRPQRPQFTAEQKAVLDSCRDTLQGQGPEAMRECAQSKGITLPEPPARPSQEQMEQVRNCHQQAILVQ